MPVPGECNAKETPMHVNCFVWSFSFLLLMGCQKQADILHIAVASNMQYAMEELVQAFQKESGIPCRYTLGSSGKLTTQILQGAPWDIFVAADSWYPLQLFNEGYAVDSPRVYAYGKLVIWSNITGMEVTLEDLSQPSVQHIAVANPQTAPYGKAALESLANSGIFHEVESKLIYGESISQTNQFILSASVQAGFTSQAVVLAPRLNGKGTWNWVADSLYQPIAQSMVLLTKGSQPLEVAREFQAYLLSASGQQILRRYGYETGVKARG